MPNAGTAPSREPLPNTDPSGSATPHYPLDEQVRTEVSLEPHHWRLAVITGIGAVPALVGVGIWLSRGLNLGPGLTSALLELLLGLIVLALTARLATRLTVVDLLGLQRLRREDLRLTLTWFLRQVFARFALALVLVSSIPSLRRGHHSTSNVTGFADLHGTDLVLAITAVVILAPVAEEMLFRGLVLRGLMRRYGFWPAAIISSVIFGALHGYELSTPAAITVLVSSTALFGLLQAMLVRRTARLGPAMLIHAISNALVIVLVLSRN